jgi:diaminopimelate decarboxylase
MNISLPANPCPIVGERMAAFLGNPDFVKGLVDGFGSPLHVVIPEQARANLRAWNTRLASIYPEIAIQFALKCCKSSALLGALSADGAGADVSSAQEMMSGFMQGIPARRMAMTGPAKTQRDIALCLAHGVSIHVDCIEELRRILPLAITLAPAARLLLRLRPQSEPKSRFGMTDSQILECLRLLKTVGHRSVGLSFHINDYEVSTRVAELRRAIGLARMFRAEGMGCFAIDIGGGFPMRYLPHHNPERYNEAPSWSGMPAAGSYPYAAPLAAHEHAAAVLNAAIGTEERRVLEADRTAILLQPGRALLDQCGLSLFAVIDVKDLGGTRKAAVLDGMSFSLSETWFGSDFVPEPLVLAQSTARRATQRGPENIFLVGRSCLESDVIRQRRIGAPNGILRGDLVAFVNTAGYQMDSNESAFHQIPVPRKMAIFQRGSGWRAAADEHGYWEGPL